MTITQLSATSGEYGVRDRARLAVGIGLITAGLVVNTGNGLPVAKSPSYSRTSAGWDSTRTLTSRPVGKTLPESAGARHSTSAALLAQLRDSSGLTWDQIARAFGVSRRSVHLWVTGGRMSSVNEEKLVTLTREIAALPGQTPDEKRREFLAARGGRSRFDELRYATASHDRDINRNIEPVRADLA